jgi:hypothetical protein
MSAAFSVVLSIIALVFSLFVFFDGRKRDRRDVFLKIHELLLSDDAPRGRQLLYEKITDEASVERLSNDEYRDVHRAIGMLNALAYYMKSGYVNQADVMSMWGEASYRACLAAQPVIDQRENRTGYRPWVHLEYLMQRSQEYVTRIGGGDVPGFTVWQRPDGGSHKLAND